jgi:hypothetical protein
LKDENDSIYKVRVGNETDWVVVVVSSTNTRSSVGTDEPIFEYIIVVAQDAVTIAAADDTDL